MNTDTQSSFEGWAILEIFGHQKYAGYVKTEYYGTACMFRCDVPPLPERERVTQSGCYVTSIEPNFPGGPEVTRYAPAGSTVKEPATIGYTKCFGVGAIYSMTPCDEAAALRAVEELQPRALMLVSLPKEKALAAGSPVDIPPETGFSCCAGNLAEGHEIGCPGSDTCVDCGKPLELCSCAEEDSL
jgi:hypothetical protein